MVESNTELSPIERDHAVVALGVHFREGRLTPEEFSSRCELAQNVAGRAELSGLFNDLPDPHFDSVLSTPQPEAETEVVREPHRYRNILDNPIFGTGITHRKLRIIGWIFAVLWIPLVGELIEFILPEFMVVGALYMPILMMIAYTIAIKPTRPKYKYMDPTTSKRHHTY